MRIKLTVVRFAVALLVAAAPLLAVTNGEPDGNRHPCVGVAIQPIPDMPGFAETNSSVAATLSNASTMRLPAVRPAFAQNGVIRRNP